MTLLSIVLNFIEGRPEVVTFAVKDSIPEDCDIVKLAHQVLRSKDVPFNMDEEMLIYFTFPDQLIVLDLDESIYPVMENKQ